MKKTVKTGILSFGMSGKLFHAPFFEENDNFELTAIVERTKKNAQEEYPTIKSYDSVNEILADPSIELIVINTPNGTHFEYAMQALRAKKHVLVEKPFTVTSAQAKQLFEEGKKNNCFAMPYQNRRYDSDLLAVKEILDSGKLGELVEAHIRYDRYNIEIGTKPAKEHDIPGSGLFYNLGPHIIDATIALFGIPVKWTKTLGKHRPNTLVDDYAHVHLQYPDDLNVYITASLMVAEERPAFVLNGTKGSFAKMRSDIQESQLKLNMKPNDLYFGIEAENMKGKLTTISSEGIKTKEEITSKRSSYRHILEDVYQSIREGKPYPVTEEHIITQLEILEA
jgi:predicted dehydrogenase|tara:strand:- start:1339 stop:2352 length:1014 start_codon:yes stop_codon:yes gene_type:complete